MAPALRGVLAAVLNAALLGSLLVLSPAAGSVHGGLLVILLVAFASIEAASARGDDVSSGAASRGPMATGVVLLAVFVTALLTASARVPLEHIGSGAILIVGGIALRRSAMESLGEAFVSEPRPRPAVERVYHGPYAALDHPSELGLLAIASGATLLVGSVEAAILCGTVLLPLVLVRTRAESRSERVTGRR